jgi:molecular chaperone GrpE
MTKDSETTDTNLENTSESLEGERPIASGPLDDQRFEVKWKKKDSGAAKPVETTTLEVKDTEALKRELEEAQQRIRDLQDKWQRAAADLANLRRRTEQERGEMEKFASMLLVSELLPVLDNFERALATIPGNLAMLTWIQGVMLIERHVRALLDHQGLGEIEAEHQPFNPHYHEAVSERESADADPGTVIQVYQKGYTMHGRVIRPALVEVARQPAAETVAGNTATTSAETVEPETTDADAAEVADKAATESVGP